MEKRGIAVADKPEPIDLAAFEPEASCRACRFGAFEGQAPGNKDLGECRMKAPNSLIVVLGASPSGKVNFTTVSGWPPIAKSQWCGDFKAKGN
jgi:hypothetical protein